MKMFFQLVSMILQSAPLMLLPVLLESFAAVDRDLELNVFFFNIYMFFIQRLPQSNSHW